MFIKGFWGVGLYGIVTELMSVAGFAACFTFIGCCESCFVFQSCSHTICVSKLSM